VKRCCAAPSPTSLPTKAALRPRTTFRRARRASGASCDLTGHQFELLLVLAQSAGRVLSRDQIMDALRGHPLDAFDRSIDVHISRIRALIEDDPKNPQRVLTVRGVGYLFAKRQDSGA
jgi:DNA-binding response OmpR family regulator